MKLFKTSRGWVVEIGERMFALPAEESKDLLLRDDLAGHLGRAVCGLVPMEGPPAPPLAPIERQEVWAAGVTYYRSRSARIEESKSAGGGDFYDRVYLAERPELFFKATPHRVAGPDETVRIRRDSRWNVPEPELTLAITPTGRIAGYTVGNDMSSRDIEGENPLYLPQAKVYDRCCALGPCVLVAEEPPPKTTTIRLEIDRGGERCFEGTTTLAGMKREPEALVEYLFRENSFPNGCFLLTGTGIVPPDSFTLQQGDKVSITIGGVGTLVNSVA